jgi:hypothetical protein
MGIYNMVSPFGGGKSAKKDKGGKDKESGK